MSLAPLTGQALAPGRTEGRARNGRGISPRKGKPQKKLQKHTRGRTSRGQFNYIWVFLLLLTDKDVDGRTAEVPLLAHVVLQKTAIRLLHVLRQIGKEHKRRYLRIGQLGDVLYLDVLALYRGGRISLDEREHLFVEAGRGDARRAIAVNAAGFFEHLQNALLGEGRSENDGEVGKGGETLADGLLEGLHHLHGLLFYQVPLVDDDDQPLVVALDDGEYI